MSTQPQLFVFVLLGAEGGFNIDQFPSIPGSVLSVDGEVFPLKHQGGGPGPRGPPPVVTQR